MPDQAAVNRAVELVKTRHTNYVYFFRQLDDPEWVAPLKDHGFFSTPPAPVTREGGTAFPSWPESEYLERVADRNPSEVAAVLEQVPETDNFRVRADLVRVAAKLPIAAARQRARRERKWMREQTWINLDYPEAVAELVRRLVRDGEWEEARKLLRGLLWIEPGEGSGIGRRLNSRVERWAYQDLCHKLFPDLVDEVGVELIALAADLLRSAVECDGRANRPFDSSEIWRPAIEAHEQNVGMDLKEDMIDVVREVAVRWINEDAARLQEVVRLLEGYEWNVFLRLALYLRSEKFDLDPESAVTAALHEKYFFNRALLHEYAGLARRAVPEMNDKEQKRWHGYLDLGPEWPPRDLDARATEKISEEDYERLVANWRRDQLALLGEALPAAWQDELAGLVERYGAAEHPDLRFYTRSWVGPTSPLSEAELAAREPKAIVKYLASWEPSDEVQAPTPEGLARLVSGRIAADPSAFAELASELAGLDPTYLRAALDGFEEAAKKGVRFGWGGPLALCEVAAAAPTENGKSSRARERRGWDPDWSWCRRETPSLLETGLREDLIPIDLADRGWAVLESLTWDPDPSPEHEEQYGGSNMDPLTLSINTIRGQAMHAVVQYAAWLKKHADDPAGFRLGSHKRLAENLENHLDPDKDRSETVRAVFGSRLLQLHWIDRGWLEGQLGRLFPEDERLRLAAWESFLVYSRPALDLFPLLEDQYRTAVESLPTPEERRDRAGKEPGFALAEHLGTFYWWGKLGLEDSGIVAQFVANASPDELAHFLDFIGRSLDHADESDIDDDIRNRLISLWDQVEEWVSGRSPEDRQKALAAFGWWYGSNALDPDWSDKTLIRLFDTGVAVESEYQVASGLEARASEDLQAALDVAQAFVRSRGERWRVFSIRQPLRQVISEGLKSEEPLKAHARQIVNELVAKGHLEFKELIAGAG